MPFEARKLPQMIDLNGEIVAGPFCRHCGYPLSLHSDGIVLRCPRRPNGVLGPCCDCHEIRTVEVTEMVPNPRGGRRTRHTFNRKYIVRI